MVPFAGVALVGVLVVLLSPYPVDPVKHSLALGLLALVLAAELVAIRRPHRSWIDPVGAWLFVIVFAVLRDAAGGALSALAPLVALPLCWLVLFGTRSDLAVASGLTAVVLFAPLFLVGGPAYPVSDWHRAALWTAFALVVAPVMQTVAHELIRTRRGERQLAAELQGILRGATLSSLITTDLSGTITGFSAGAERLLGYRAEEMIGLHTPARFHNESEVRQVAEELGVAPGFETFAELAHRHSPSRIWTYVHADGSRLFVRLAITELTDPDGVRVGYLGVAIDATEAISSQRALARAEERWRVVMDRLADTTVVVMSPALDVQLVAGAGAMRVGMGDAVGKSIHELSSPQNVAVVERMVSDALAGGAERAELNATVSGAEQEVFATALPARGEEGPTVLLMARDVSRDRARQRELVRARELAERIFHDSTIGLALANGDDEIVRANRALAEMVGLAADVPTGPTDGDHDESPWRRDLARHLHERRSSPTGRLTEEISLETGHGDTRYLLVSSTALTTPDGATEQALVQVQDVTERRRYEEQLGYLADHDALTGLANRRRFGAELIRHIDICRRSGPRGALLLIDLDHFKEVNDTLGHFAGDELIISVATALRATVRSTDVVARLGGDEFALLLTDADRSAAELVAEKLVVQVREQARGFEGAGQRVTASIGVVLVDERNLDATDILAAADMTMYDAKEAGRDQWALLDYERHDGPRVGARMAWNDRIRAAIDHDHLELHLQPIWSIAESRVTGAEALLRLSDEDEPVLPQHFVYIAEMSELIRDLDGWVIAESVRLLTLLQQRQPDFKLEVNISGKSIGDPTLSSRLAEALARHPVDPSGLVLEITETAAVADLHAAQAFSAEVARFGCGSALDDFGAGFGSFYYLKHLHFDLIKIDGEFVATCHVNSTDRTILRSIVGIARGLGKSTVAEFVSEAAVLDVVREEGVDFAQGHHIGSAVPFEQFVDSYLGTSHQDGTLSGR